MKEKEILKILKKIGKKIDQLPKPSTAEEAHEMIDVLMSINETLEKFEQKISAR
jgi:hypothetical protein